MSNPIRPARLDRLRRRRRHPGDRLRHGQHVAVRHDRRQPGCGERGGRRQPPTPPPAVTPAPLPATGPAPTAAPSSAGSSASAPAVSPSRSLPSRPSSQKFNDSPRRTSTSRSRSTTTTSPASMLATQIAAGNAPDIIGPVGVEGLNIFRDQLLDLAPLIDVDRLRHEQVRPGAGRLLQDRRGRRHDRRAVRDLSVVALVQQEAVRRGQAAATRRPRSATCTRASPGTWTRSATSA